MGKVILKKMLHKIISYFSQCTYIVKGLPVLVLVFIFITAPTASGYSLNPQLSYLGNKTRVEFVNIYIVYEQLSNNRKLLVWCS